jgi:hypothetical protein
MSQSILKKLRKRHAKLLEMPEPLPPAAPGIIIAISRIDEFLRRDGLPFRIIQKARVARSSLRAVLKLL